MSSPLAEPEESEQGQHEDDNQDDPENRHGGAPFEIVVAEQTDNAPEWLRGPLNARLTRHNGW